LRRGLLLCAFPPVFPNPDFNPSLVPIHSSHLRPTESLNSGLPTRNTFITSSPK
jgi:hypothetical protein